MGGHWLLKSTALYKRTHVTYDSPMDFAQDSAFPRSRSDFSGWWIVAPLIIVGLLLVMETTDIDRMVTYWTFDATTHTFPLRHAFLLEKVLHDWAKYVVQVFALCVLCAFLMTWRIARLRPYRKMLLFLWLALALATSSVTLLKDITHKDCPWDLEEFGGYAPYLRLFDAAQSAYKPGRCFPAGHASTGFSLMALYFVGHVLNNRRLAWGGLIFGIGAGFLLGGARMLQGAHFLSHTLWSAVVCWVVIVTLYWAFYMRKVDNRTTSSEPVQQQSTT